jgi:hypothetical protein
MQYFKFLNQLPAIPPELINQIVYVDSNNIDKSTTVANKQELKEHKVIVNDGSIQDGALYYRTPVTGPINPTLDQWLYKNIDELTNSDITTAVQYCTSVSGAASALLPHTDGGARGRYTMLYLIKSGNPNNPVTTHWWQQPGEDLVRPPHTVSLDSTKLVEMAKTELSIGTWVMIKTNIIHSVQNIIDSRIAISVAVHSDEIAELIAEKY